MLFLAGCATPSAVVKKTFDDPTYTESSYSDVLVIGVGGDYSNRATFERAMVSRIAAAGASATAYYTVVGRNQPITRNAVTNVIRSRGFDSVLLTRVISQATDVSVADGSSETKVTRKPADRAIDLFRYDYDELTEPGTFNISSTVTLSAEMFHATDERRMWAIESTIADKEHVGQIIESAADTIVSQLRKDRLVGD
jgi:hypothetical protein